MENLISLLYIFFLIYLSIVRFVYWATSKKEDCPISNDDKWNPKKWLSFAYGTFMEWLIPPHVLEQVWGRYTNEDCKQCLDKGCCVNCGCNTYAKMLDPKAACSSLYWDTIMPKEQWEARKVFLDNLKESNKIKDVGFTGSGLIRKINGVGMMEIPDEKYLWTPYAPDYSQLVWVNDSNPENLDPDCYTKHSNSLYELVHSKRGSLDIKPITEIETNKSIDGKKIKINKFKPYSDGEE